MSRTTVASERRMMPPLSQKTDCSLASQFDDR
jgi:hypothetical protein